MRRHLLLFQLKEKKRKPFFGGTWGGGNWNLHATSGREKNEWTWIHWLLKSCFISIHILFTIIFQKSFSNKTIVAMNLHQTLEIEVPKSVLSVCVFWFKDILWTNYIHIIFTNYSKVIWSDEKPCHDWGLSSIL